jgi:hypothetical protein
MGSSLSRIHDHTQFTPQLVGLLWTSDQPVVETFTYQHTNSQTSMLPERFEPTIPTSERPQTDALDRAAAGTSIFKQTPNLQQGTLFRP